MEKLAFDDIPVSPYAVDVADVNKDPTLATFQVFGRKAKKLDGEYDHWCNTHQAQVVKVTDSGCLLFGHVAEDELVFDHGYGAGVWVEFKRL